MRAKVNSGVVFAAAAYTLWGFFPIYFKALKEVPAPQVLAHRIVWAFLFLLGVLMVRHEVGTLRRLLTRRILLSYFGAGVLLAINWLAYVWGVAAGFIVETSLGYFINPLVSVVLGVLFLRERLRPWQWLPVGLAAVGVAYLTLEYGRLPWLALVLALSFGLYGLLKKLAPLNALHGLTLETGSVFLPALAYLVGIEIAGQGAFGHGPLSQTVLLALTGVVTAIPLLLFAGGARRVPLTMLGLLQYIAPSLQFLLGVFVYGEPFGPAQLVGFSLIWLALAIFSAEGVLAQRRQRLIEAEAAGDD
ncbi:EamA family transporter RarD [Thermanaerothrix sp.]|jgi:chloramphenicol-sensitive protein RarD|uniref:EamA family transporter RarD n=1 Tax=Thermanaerothrix sp. TaxID=2972675 RepID=UPI002ADE3756|nr:EamA family transporter RarD [Thermanaerothrix sp.]